MMKIIQAKNGIYITLLSLLLVFTSCTYRSEDKSPSDNILHAPPTFVLSEYDYLLNTRSKKIHKPTCGSVSLMDSKNKKPYDGDLDDLYIKGYTTCGNCFREQRQNQPLETKQEG